MNRFFIITRILGYCICASAVSSGSPEPQLDTDGCRVLSPLPAPGVHPRVLFTAEEIPEIKARYEGSRFGAALKRAVDDTVRRAPAAWGEFASLDLRKPGVEQIEKHLRNDEGRNIRWGIASLYAVMYDDPELKKLMIGVITNYARIMIASKEMAVGGELKGRTGTELNKVFRI